MIMLSTTLNIFRSGEFDLRSYFEDDSRHRKYENLLEYKLREKVSHDKFCRFAGIGFNIGPGETKHYPEEPEIRQAECLKDNFDGLWDDSIEPLIRWIVNER